MRLLILFVFAACGGHVMAQQPVHMANYAKTSDFPVLAGLGVNTLLVDLSPDGSDWTEIYDAAIEHDLRLIPLVWGNEQAIWKWNKQADEWELNAETYPKSKGAQFLQFLKDNRKYLRQTFSIYSFHEPLHKPKKTGPQRLQKFYQQITEEEFPDNALLVYGEDMTMGWPQSDECLTGVLDYESHTYTHLLTPKRAKGIDRLMSRRTTTAPARMTSTPP